PWSHVPHCTWTSWRKKLPTDPHRLLERPAHLRRLAEAVAERPQARLQQRILLVVLEHDAFGHFLLLVEGQIDAPGEVGAADDRLGVAALGDGVEIIEQALADHGDAHIAGAEVLLGAIGDAALADPGDDVLVDDVAGDPAAALVLDRADPR